MSLILLALGLYVLVRFTVRGLRRDRLGQPLRNASSGPSGSSPASSTPRAAAAGAGGDPAILASGRLDRAGSSVDRHERVPGLAGCQHRLPAGAGVPGRQRHLGRRAAHRWPHRGPDRRLAGAPRPPRVLGSAVGASSSSPTAAPCCAATGSTLPSRRGMPCTPSSSSCGSAYRCAPTLSGTSTSREPAPHATPADVEARRSPTRPEGPRAECWRGLKAGGDWGPRWA